ncbi:hypothetical protein [Streptacidiphilus albus]|uniref:hypothetical protein n=1 Tax=Streptacidiphilus albus TaxID=105425 RepID=UPI00054BB8FB|nr:hypothetical protein [Streptacidiphilus albus]
MPARIRRPVVVQTVCPACRAVRKAQPLGTTTIGQHKHQILECLDQSCGLRWLTSRTTTPQAA